MVQEHEWEVYKMGSEMVSTPNPQKWSQPWDSLFYSMDWESQNAIINTKSA